MDTVDEHTRQHDEDAIEANDYDSAWEEGQDNTDLPPAASGQDGREDNDPPASDEGDPNPEVTPEGDVKAEPSANDELERLRRENEELRRFAEPRQQPGNPHAPAPTADDLENPDDWDEELKAEFNTFIKAYPEMAALAQEKSRIGKGIRERLLTYGADDAADWATPIFEARQVSESVQRSFQEREQQRAIQQRQEFQTTVFAALPDFKEAMESGKGPEFVGQVEQWARGKPYDQAMDMLRIINNGSAEETISLVRRFQQERQEEQGKQTDQSVKQAARAMAAVPGSHQPMHPGGPAPKRSDYDAAWDEND